MDECLPSLPRYLVVVTHCIARPPPPSATPTTRDAAWPSERQEGYEGFVAFPALSPPRTLPQSPFPKLTRGTDVITWMAAISASDKSRSFDPATDRPLVDHNFLHQTLTTPSNSNHHHNRNLASKHVKIEDILVREQNMASAIDKVNRGGKQREAAER